MLDDVPQRGQERLAPDEAEADEVTLREDQVSIRPETLALVEAIAGDYRGRPHTGTGRTRFEAEDDNNDNDDEEDDQPPEGLRRKLLIGAGTGVMVTALMVGWLTGWFDGGGGGLPVITDTAVITVPVAPQVPIPPEQTSISSPSVPPSIPQPVPVPTAMAPSPETTTPTAPSTIIPTPEVPPPPAAEETTPDPVLPPPPRLVFPSSPLASPLASPPASPPPARPASAAHSPAPPPMPTPPPASASGKGGYVVVVGSYKVAENAENTAARLRTKGLQAEVTDYTDRNNQSWKQVRVGPFTTQGEAETKRGTVRTAVGGQPVVIKTK
ncbi:putative Cell division protein FtsN [uncultured Gammaproteobacteria bacterium]